MEPYELEHQAALRSFAPECMVLLKMCIRDRYVACAISLAFVEPDLGKVLEKALEYIPADCEYARVVRAVTAYHREHPENWRDCYHYIFQNFGYDKYPGNCHIIPNAAVMILAMLYGGGEFERTLCICNMCGWDLSLIHI